MGNTAGSPAAPSRRKRVSRCLESFRQLVNDVRHLNINCARYFEHPRTGEHLEFRIFTRLPSAALVPLLWRFGDNVVVVATPRAPVAPGLGARGPAAAPAAATFRTGPGRVLSLRQFYSLFLFMCDNVHQMQASCARRDEAGRRCAELAERKVDAEEDGGAVCSLATDPERGLCSICLDRPEETVLSCMHAFCNECIAGWHAKDATCPLCRRGLPDGAAGDRDSWVVESGEFDGGDEDLSAIVLDVAGYPIEYVSDKPVFDAAAAPGGRAAGVDSDCLPDRWSEAGDDARDPDRGESVTANPRPPPGAPRDPPPPPPRVAGV